MFLFPCERRSQARSSCNWREVLATRLAVLPLSHPKCFPVTGRTGELQEDWLLLHKGVGAPLLGPASVHSFWAVIWHRQVPAVSQKPGFKALPHTVFLSLWTGAGQQAPWLSPLIKCTANALCQLMLAQDETHAGSPGALYLLKAG